MTVIHTSLHTHTYRSHEQRGNLIHKRESFYSQSNVNKIARTTQITGTRFTRTTHTTALGQPIRAAKNKITTDTIPIFFRIFRPCQIVEKEQPSRRRPPTHARQQRIQYNPNKILLHLLVMKISMQILYLLAQKMQRIIHHPVKHIYSQHPHPIRLLILLHLHHRYPPIKPVYSKRVPLNWYLCSWAI